MLALVVRAAAELMLHPEVGTVEDAAAALPGMLHRLSLAYAAEAGIPDYTAVALLELGFAGWSEQAQCMRMWGFASYCAYEPNEQGADWHGKRSFPAVPPGFMPHLDGKTLPRQLVQIFEALQRFGEARPDLQIKIGGELLAFEVSRDGITQRTIHRFADYEQTKHAGAAVRARVMRGDLQVSVADGLVPVADMEDAATGKALTRQQRRQLERAGRKQHAA